MLNLLSDRYRAPRRLAQLAIPLMLGVTAAPAWSADVVYAESNSTAGNSILAFENDGSGALHFLGSTAAGGIGVFDTSFALGPFDSDQNLLVSRDRALLFAVNSGSNSVAVFRIDGSGGLSPVSGSPFASGGLDPINDSPVSVAYGSSPSQAAIAAVGPFVFGADFLGGLLQSFALDESGHLMANPPQAVPDSVFAGSAAPHLPLGLRAHPTEAILYVDLVTVSQVAVYRYNEQGRLQFVKTVADPGAAPCWAIVNHRGTRLYAINTGDTSVAVYDITQPLNPKVIQHFAMAATSGNAFSAVIDDSDQFIYVSGEQSTATATAAANAIHTLRVAADGTLSEPFPPTELPISGLTRAQGVAVFSTE